MNMFDAIILSIVLLLAIKGFFNGFIKEIAGLIGIVAGIYFASKYNHQVGEYINQNLFSISNSSAIDLVGYVATFVGVWFSVIFIGFIFSKALKLSALGILDRLLGVVFASGKFFVIISIIVVMLSNIKIVNEKLQKYTANSIVYPYMIDLGKKLINLSPNDLKNHLKDVKIPKL